MKHSVHHFSIICGFVSLLASMPASAAAPARIHEPLEDGQQFVLSGNTHRFAVAPADEGEAPEALPLTQITIHFKMSDAQQAELNQLLEEQQNPSSVEYHKWLTPEEYGQRFGISTTDVDKIVAWLESSGFSNVQVNRSRTAVSMSGTAGLVRSNFQTPIHRYQTGGVEHYANSTDPKLPRALEGMVSGIRGLNDFHPRPHVVRRKIAAPLEPRFTSSISGDHFLAPSDFATIYDVQALYNSGINGSGQKIAIPGQVSITLSDIRAFRSAAGLPANDPQIVEAGAPDKTNSGDETESDLDVEWAGAVAPQATIIFITSGDAFTSVNYAIDNNTAPVLSITYGDCEANFGQAELDAENSAFQQANAQGITIVTASGDTGAADCDGGSGPNPTPPAKASQGLAVDFPSSSPYVTGMGGTELNEATGNYWNSTNNAQNGSARSYIPEKVWNDTSADGQLSAGGGGRSVLFTKPNWQQGPNVPNDGWRDVPDLALAASADHDPYLICSGGDCVNGFRDSNSYLDTVGGTSAAAPAFAAVVALLNQRMASSQGNITPALYRLAASSPSAFHDTTVGNNEVPCVSGSTDCSSSGVIGYAAEPGYDLASGLGSIDAYNLVNGWSGATNIRAVTQVAGILSQVSVGADGTAWGVDGSGAIYTFNTQSQSWQQAPGSLSQISVGSNGAVWGLTGFGGIYRLDSNTQNWVNVAGNLSQIAVGADGDVWGLNAAQQIYHFDSATQAWKQIPGSLSKIAVGFDGAVWGLNAQQQIYRLNSGTQSFNGVPGSLAQIAVGADGDVWGINSSDQIYHFDSLTQGWDRISGTLAQISVGSASNVWALDPSGAIYNYNAQSQIWEPITGNLTQIAAGANGSVWGVNSAGRIYQFVQPTQQTQTFHVVPGALAQIAASSDGDVWGISSGNQVYFFDRLTQSWTWIPGELARIAIASDGNVWGINSQGQIYMFDSSAQTWVGKSGQLSQIAVADNGDVWGINSNDAIFRYDASAQKWTQVPGALAQISVGADGAVWGLNSSGGAYELDPQTQLWTQMPGTFSQIAVGSAANVWALNSTGQIFRFDAQTQNWNQLPGNLAQISVAFDGAVWGLALGGDIFRFDAQTQNWDLIDGSLSQIVVGADAVVWGINSAQSIFRFQ